MPPLRSRPGLANAPRRPRDRGRNFRRARRPDHPISVSSNAASEVASEPTTTNNRHAFFDNYAEHHWRIPMLWSPRKLRLLNIDDTSHDDMPSDAPTPWSHPTPEPGSDTLNPPSTTSTSRPYSNSIFDRRLPPNLNHFQHHHRSDRRATPSQLDFPNSSSSHPHSHSHSRDRAAKRFPHNGNNGARWRGLLARKDLVDGKVDAYRIDTSNEDNNNNNTSNITPRSSLDIEEAVSLYSWEADPPSTSVRGWRSNHSLSYRPKPNDRPRHIRVIGRQRCINDLTDIVDASNEPCVSYDRQIFDPVSKLWTYVEASQPSSSPWELRTVGSPVTCSVSGTEEAVSTTTTRTGRTITNTTANSNSSNIPTIQMSSITHSTTYSTATNTSTNTANSSRTSTSLGNARSVSVSISSKPTAVVPTPTTPIGSTLVEPIAHTAPVALTSNGMSKPNLIPKSTTFSPPKQPNTASFIVVQPNNRTTPVSEIQCPLVNASRPPPPPPPPLPSSELCGKDLLEMTSPNRDSLSSDDGYGAIRVLSASVSDANSNATRQADTLVQEIEVLKASLETHARHKLACDEKDQGNKRRNSSPPIAAVTDGDGTKRVFMTARERWLGYSRKSVYGPANLEAVIFASELDDAKEGALRRASMV